MENNVLKTAMMNSISDVLETMFFLPLDFSEASSAQEIWGNEKDQIVAATLKFGGPFSGYCGFYIHNKLAMSITADFMGIDEENISKEHVNETVKEILNMIVGNVFSSLDPQEVFNLAVPELIVFDGNGVDPSESKEDIFIGIDTLDSHIAFQMVILN